MKLLFVSILFIILLSCENEENLVMKTRFQENNPTSELEQTITPMPESTATPMPESTATPMPEPTATPMPESTANPTFEYIYIDVEFTDKVNIYLNLEIPKGFMLKELIVEKYKGKDKIAFFAIQEGTTYTAGDNILKMVSWGHFGPESGNILFYSDNLESKNKVPVTLSSGKYSIRFAQNNYKDAKYFLSGKLISTQQ